MSYFAQKMWLYLMIWLPRTTDNSTHFAQSLEIRGNESRLYINLIFCQLHSNMIIGHLIKIDHIQNGHEKQNGHQLKQKGLNSNFTSKLFNFLMVYMKECLEEVNCEKISCCRPLVKNAYKKNNFLISQPKHMLCVLKKNVSMRRFF